MAPVSSERIEVEGGAEQCRLPSTPQNASNYLFDRKNKNGLTTDGEAEQQREEAEQN